jgi:hypothetical protein
MKLLASIFTLAVLAFSAVHSQFTNCTIDDTDDTVFYKGSWGEIGPTSLDYGSTHALSSDSSATAIFCFKGVAIYYMSPLWPYPVNSMVSLDGSPGECVSLQDSSTPPTDGGPETVKSAPVWGVEGLKDGEHELIVSMCPGGQFVVVDAFIYTVANASATSSSSSSATHTGVVGAASSTPDPPTNSSPNHTTVIAVSSIIAALALLAALLACLFCFRRRRRKRLHHQLPDFKYPGDGRDTYDDGYTPVPSRFSTTSRFTSTSGMLYPHIAINDPFDPTNAPGLYDRWFSSPLDFGNIFSYYQGPLSSMFNDQPRTRLSTVKS